VITKQQTRSLKKRLQESVREVLGMTPEQLQAAVDEVFKQSKLTGTPDELRRSLLMWEIDKAIPDSLCY
jgi:hypothetical protein